ncbi:hypothetical protein [Tomitella gaofuii]|uniref:hypothetical protein n=1 Tax=Tomitella gaofuii TaxID=2760083 RepID=UPI0015FCF299|nr:hypothetical protein [Tomitella gaofuii]
MDHHLAQHARSAASALLAAAICMAITQIIWLALGEDVSRALLFGLSLSSIAFGGTYAGTFFVGIRRAGDA